MKKRYKLVNGDCLKVMQKIPDNSIHAVVTDPPYGLSKEPDIALVLNHWLNDKQYKHDAKGFMNNEWDSFVPGPEYWKEAYRILKHGGHMLVFAGSRTQDLMSIALRLAGFEIRDTLMWMYGTGFPKNLDIQKSIAKMPKGDLIDFSQALKAKRLELGLTVSQADTLITGGTTMYAFMEGRVINGNLIIYPPNKRYYKNIVQQFNLKGWESIIDNNIKYEKKKSGSFGYQQNGKRWTNDTRTSSIDENFVQRYQGWGTQLKPAYEPIILVRKPLIGNVANNVLQHSTGGINIDACRIPVDINDPQLRTISPNARNSSDGWGMNNKKKRTNVQVVQPSGRWPANVIHDGSEEVVSLFPVEKFGNASRFFYCAKVSRKERNEGLSHLEDIDISNSANVQGIKNNINTSSGKKRNVNTVTKNSHPTVKPLSLMSYLVKLISPVGGVVLDPFMGSGSTGIVALSEGFRFIGIEMDERYYEIATNRIAHHYSKHKPKKLFE